MHAETTIRSPEFAGPADLRFLKDVIDAQAVISTVEPDPDVVIRVMLEQAQRLCGGEGALFNTVGDDAITCRVGLGSLRDRVGVRLDRHHSLSAHAVRERRPMISDDVDADPRVDHKALAGGQSHTRSFLIVPLPHGDAIIGVLMVASTRVGAFNALHAAAMQMIAGMLAAKLGHAEAFAANRRALDERSAALEALRASERRFRLLADNAAVGIYEADAEGRNTFVNARWADMSGMSVEDCAGGGWAASVHPSDRERAIAAWFNATQAGREYACEYRINGRDGRALWVHSHAVPIRDERGVVTGYIGTATDVTDRKRREWMEVDRGEVLEMLARGEAMPAVLRRLGAGVSRQIDKVRVAVAPAEGGDAALAAAFVDAGLPAALVEAMRPYLGDIAASAAAAFAEAAPEATTACGPLPADVWAVDLLSDPRFRDLRVPATVHRLRTLWLRAVRGGSGASLGSVICCTAEARVPSPAESQTIVAAARMAALVIETRLKSERIAHAATHDPLTALPNRATCRDRLGLALASARRSGEAVGVVAIDVDLFKQINDTRGHAAGDAVLRMFAQRLRATLRQSDTLARLGGDEFAALLPRVADAASLDAVGRKLVEALAEPFELPGGPLRVTGSFGIACFPHDGADVDSLLAAADEALYVVKARGRNGYHVRAAPPVKEAA